MHKTIEKKLKTYSRSRKYLIRLLGFNSMKFLILKRKSKLYTLEIQRSHFWGRECDGYKWKVWWNDKMKGPLAMTLGDRPVFH